MLETEYAQTCSKTVPLPPHSPKGLTARMSQANREALATMAFVDFVGSDEGAKIAKELIAKLLEQV